MQTSAQPVARHGSAILPRHHSYPQHVSQSFVGQLPRLRPVGGQRVADMTGHRPLLLQCSAGRQHMAWAAAPHSAEHSERKRHVRGWSSTQRSCRFSRGSAVAASDDSDSTDVTLYSSSDASSSEASCTSSDASGSDAEAVTPRDAGAGDGSVASIQLDMPRRSMQVTFTCDKCGARTARMVNPLAWDKGLVLAQCSGCEAWHKLRDAGGLVQEIRYVDEQP